MTRAAQDTARAMTQGFSDLFFDLFTGQVKSLSDVFKAFGLSMIRVLTDFLASQAAKALLSFFTDLISGFSGSSGGGLVGTIIAAAGALLAKFSGSTDTVTKAAAAIDKLTPASEEAATALDSISGASTGANAALSATTNTAKNFAAGLSAALSAVGVVVGIISLVKGGSASSMALTAAGTAISAYSLAQSVSVLAQSAGLIATALPTISALIGAGLAAIAPSFALALATSPLFASLAPAITAGITNALINAGVVLGPAVGGAAGTGAAAGTAAGLGVSAGIVAGIAAVIAMPLFAGFSGMAQDAEQGAASQAVDALEVNKAVAAYNAVIKLFSDWATAIDAVHLPDTLAKVSDALQSLPDLALAIGLGAEDLNNMIPTMRAQIGAALISALDAAAKQGVDASAVTAARFDPWPGSGGPGQGHAVAMMDDIDRIIATGAYFNDGFGSRSLKVLQAMKAILQDLFNKANANNDLWNTNPTPGPGVEGGNQDLSHQMPNAIDPLINPDDLRALVNKEFLTIALRNAVVDIGMALGISLQKLADAGLGSDVSNSRVDSLGVDQNPGQGTSWRLEGGANLPSVAEIAAVQATLDAAGFKPGEYGKALEAFLISVDANVVNNPLWKTFTDALEAGDKAGDPNTVANAAAAVKHSPAAFSQAAGSIIDALNQQIADQVKASRATADPDALAAITKTIAALQTQLAAWSDGFKHLYAVAANVSALLPPDLAAQFRATLTPAYDTLMAAMKSGSTDAATVAAALFAEQVAEWDAFAQSIAAAVDVNALVSALLPTDLSTRLRTELQPAYDEILAALKAGNATLAKLLIEQFNKVVAAWAALAKLTQTIDAELATSSGNPSDTIAAWGQQVAQMDRDVARAKAAFDAAIASGDVEAIAKAGAAYHDAVVTRFQTELAMAKDLQAAWAAVETNIKDALDTTGTALVAQASEIADHFLSRGNADPFKDLLTRLEVLARTSDSAALRIWAVAQAIKTIIAAIPVGIAGGNGVRGLGGTTGAASDWAGVSAVISAADLAPYAAQIGQQIGAAALPFLIHQRAQIDSLIAAGDNAGALALLQQEAGQIRALGEAAIAGVKQWAQQAIAGAQGAAQAEIDRLTTVRDLQLAAIDAQIAGIQKAAQAAQAARRVEMQALQTAIQKAREWESAIKSATAFIEQLKLGSMAPINPADQLIQAQGTFAAALAAYQAHPSAQGLTDLQGMAQAVLQAASQVFTRPSPEYQALFASIVTQLQAASDLATSQAPDSSTVLQAQLDALQALDATATQAAQDQIDALNAQKTQISKDFETQTADIRAKLAEQIKAIEDAAAAEIAVLEDQIAAALTNNALKQEPLLQSQVDTQLAIRDALVSAGYTVADSNNFIGAQAIVTNGLLKEIRDAIAAFPHAAGGMAYVPATMPVVVHQGERILTADANRAYRSGYGLVATRGTVPQAQRSGGTSITFAPVITVTGGGDPALIKATVKEALRESQREFMRNLESGPESSRLRSSR